MCIGLIGGMDRLERHYRQEAEKFGIHLKVFSQAGADMASKIKNVDALIIFTNKVSHRAKKEAMSIDKSKNILVLLHHSCGICTLRECFHCLKKQN